MTTVFASRNWQTCHVPMAVKILTKCSTVHADANLNNGTPIFKTRILAPFVSHDFLITPFHMQNVFISKAKHILNTKVLKLTPHLHDTRCYWLKCQILPHHTMQILVNFEIEGKCIRQRLLDTTNEVLLSLFCYRWLISFPIWEWKRNGYSPYSFSENR